MIKIFFIILALISMRAKGNISSHSILKKYGCINCHLSSAYHFNTDSWDFRNFQSFKRIKNRQNRCVECHIIVSKEKNIESLSYLNIPSLKFRKNSFIKYTSCGLRQFLNAPFSKRFNAKESMFPLPAKKIDDLIKELDAASLLADCSKLAKITDKGKVLYKKYGCIHCHSQGQSSGKKIPRLRTGAPLLSFKYFKDRVKKGIKKSDVTFNFKWVKDKNKIKKSFYDQSFMPSYRNITEKDLLELYSYISQDRTDLSANEFIHRPIQVNSEKDIYRIVQEEIFDKSCRHCHSPGLETSKNNHKIFGYEHLSSKKDIVSFPLSKGQEFRPNDNLKRVLSPGPECSDSIFIESLRRRHDEWTGEGRGERRGMPLTIRPVAKNIIEIAKKWTERGCKSPWGELCKKCEITKSKDLIR